jgi:hypothetical protein
MKVSRPAFNTYCSGYLYVHHRQSARNLPCTSISPCVTLSLPTPQYAPDFTCLPFYTYKCVIAYIARKPTRLVCMHGSTSLASSVSIMRRLLPASSYISKYTVALPSVHSSQKQLCSLLYVLSYTSDYASMHHPQTTESPIGLPCIRHRP